MKLKFLAVLVAITGTVGWRSSAQIYDTNNEVVQTFAGSGFSGYLDGVGQLTMFSNPSQIVADSSSNLFVLDSGNARIRKITPDGTVSTFAGGGTAGLPGYGTNVSISTWGIYSMAIDHSNALWVTSGYNVLLRIGSDGYVSKTNFSGVSYSWGVCVDSGNSIYFSDYYGMKIYRYHQTNSFLEVFAGSGNLGSVDGNGIFTSFNYPTALAADAADNIYVWDSDSFLIRRIDQNKNVTTIAGNGIYNNSSDGMGTNSGFANVSGMCADSSGNIILDCFSSLGVSIRKMSPTTNVVTMAGSFTQNGFTNGAGNLARFKNAGGPTVQVVGGVCVSQGMVFVADSGNQRIRQISFNPQPQVVPNANLGIGTFAGVTITGTVGRTYQVQSSTNMATWNTVATVLLTSSPYLWIDQNPVSGSKFYRAVMLP